MSILLGEAQLRARQAVACGPLLSLTDSLSADLETVLARDLFIPPEKARMTRRGGRCEVDGTVLEFDPFSPRKHRCSRCGRSFDDDTHYRWWVMGYQLWLAERAVHSASLFAVRGDSRHRDFARAVLEGYAQRYLTYPNADNVLGPTRLFFSTYLESIWLLQIITSLDLLELSTAGEWHAALGARVRDRVIEPSAALIAGYDEGLSNRQVWNNAALLAAARVLSRPISGPALAGASGLTAHLTSGLLADGTWYEGENYHLFAHRGLWYGVTIAAAAGVELDRSLVGRFDEAFATPFMTALPDFTFPSRRDSQYAVSLRQWRFAELAELGLARQPGEARLLGALATLYDGSIDRHDTARAVSTAEAERNTPATSLDRSDLGWRSLLFALPALPSKAASTPASVLMPGQGFAILRREQGALYAALDYGHSGAGHGHPDRLNVILVRGTDRILDDVGTGSYVDPSLHWYRSSLAHNAPLVDGRSQARVNGALVAFDDRGAAGWARAFVENVAPGVHLQRTLVAMPGYLIDELAWKTHREVQIDLPFHIAGDLRGVTDWIPGVPAGGADLEDGFAFLRDTAYAAEPSVPARDVRLVASAVEAMVVVEGAHVWWRATSFGPPGSDARRFYFVRAKGAVGRITTVWDFANSIRSTRVGSVVSITLRDGGTHEHDDGGDSWRVTMISGDSRSSIQLAGAVGLRGHATGSSQTRPGPDSTHPPYRIGPRLPPTLFELRGASYRQSEQPWVEAGRPTARIGIAIEGDLLVVTAWVSKRDVYFAPPVESNPLDNEPADINSDGLQLHLIVDTPVPSSPGKVELTYLLVPDEGGSAVRVTSRSSHPPAPSPDVTWSRTSEGYTIRWETPLGALGLAPGSRFLLGVAVNDMTADRERRRGQLVLGEVDGGFVYLRGDRLSPDRHLPFVIADG